MSFLEILDGEFGGRKVRLKGPDFLIGRERGKNHLVLPDETVSRRHVRLTIAGAAVTLEDLKTVNGTLMNGRRLEEAARLAVGDEFQIGATRLRFLGDQNQAPAAPAVEEAPAADAAPPEHPAHPAHPAHRKSTRAVVPRAPARKAFAPSVAGEDRFQKLLARLDAEEEAGARRVGLFTEDLGQRSRGYTAVVGALLVLGGIAFAGLVWALCLYIVAEG